MKSKVLTDEAVQIVGVARVVWNGEAAVTDGHLALAEGHREEAQLVQQTAERLEEETPQVSHPDRGDGSHQKVHTPNHRRGARTRKPSPVIATHPDICLCSDDLVVVQVHHLRSTI